MKKNEMSDEGRMLPQERYYHDAQFKMLVDTLEKQIHDAQFTPSELREAAILAAIHYENKRISPHREQRCKHGVLTGWACEECEKEREG